MEIQIYQKMQDPLAAIDRLGEFFAKSGMFGCQRIEQGKVLAMVCLTNNMTPDEVASRYHIIDGQLSKKALAVLADFRRKGGKHKWVDPGFNGKQATGEFTFEGYTIVVTYTLEDAKRQGLVRPNSNWVKTPGNMLRARVISNAIGMLAPEIYCGGQDDVEDPFIPGRVHANIDSAPTPQTASTSPAESPLSPAIDVEVTEEDKLVDMGIASVKPKPAPVPSRKSKTRPPVEIAPAEPDSTTQPASIEPDSTGEPIPPVEEINPSLVEEAEAAQVEPATRIQEIGPDVQNQPQTPSEWKALDADTVEEIGQICAGHYVEVANWLIKQQWLESPGRELKTEAHAAAWLQNALPKLKRNRAKKILTKKLAFMRAVEEVEQ